MTQSLPLVCLVTDRRRLAARLGRDPDSPGAVAALLEQIGDAVAARVDLVQIRERDLTARALASLVRQAVMRARGSGTAILVNDRMDVAVAAGAAGVHLPERSLPPERVRAAAPDLIVGQSLHGVSDVATARAVSYVVFGTVFPTRSKPAGHSVAGLDALAAAAASTSVPVLAIGGVTLENVAGVARAGAAGVAAVDLFLPSGPERDAGRLREIVRSVRRAFDTRQRVS